MINVGLQGKTENGLKRKGMFGKVAVKKKCGIFFKKKLGEKSFKTKEWFFQHCWTRRTRGKKSSLTGGRSRLFKSTLGSRGKKNMERGRGR